MTELILVISTIHKLNSFSLHMLFFMSFHMSTLKSLILFDEILELYGGSFYF